MCVCSSEVRLHGEVLVQGGSTGDFARFCCIALSVNHATHVLYNTLFAALGTFQSGNAVLDRYNCVWVSVDFAYAYRIL